MILRGEGTSLSPHCNSLRILLQCGLARCRDGEKWPSRRRHCLRTY